MMHSISEDADALSCSYTRLYGSCFTWGVFGDATEKTHNAMLLKQCRFYCARLGVANHASPHVLRIFAWPHSCSQVVLLMIGSVRV